MFQQYHGSHGMRRCLRIVPPLTDTSSQKYCPTYPSAEKRNVVIPIEQTSGRPYLKNANEIPTASASMLVATAGETSLSGRRGFRYRLRADSDSLIMVARSTLAE